MRVQFNLPSTFVAEQHLMGRPAQKHGKQPRVQPKPRSVPRPRPLPKPGGAR
ncbi:hypothetical protein HII36_06255 [Nonomuraea sp. NN258]|uniref:hypothetical protein n=1 Tax=Nonomuraea antri TaxID=2730852 RepID=UPI00156A10B9|nr:hypothetical protein [Nonomuraea antri]NRQ31443.1 hypothetical protein [Nonomuraea antri]